MADIRTKLVLKIARQIDQAGAVEDDNWLVPTRWAREVADRLVEAVEDPNNAARLKDRHAFASLSEYVISIFDGKIVSQRRESVLDRISELEAYLDRPAGMVP